MMPTERTREREACSNVISFPAPTAKVQGPGSIQDAVIAVAQNSSTICSTLLLQGVGDLEQAVNKVAAIVTAMPDGEARRIAEGELRSIRSQLETAKSLSREVAIPDRQDP